MDLPEWVAFDVYATLMNREEGAGQAFKEILRINGAEDLNPREIFNAWHHAVIRKYRTSFTTWKEAGRESLPEIFSRFNIPGKVEDIEILYGSFSNWKPYPDVVPSLSKLAKRFKLGVITNMDTDLFEKTKIGVTFNDAVTSEMAEAYKPHPKIFEYALERFGCQRDELLMVGTTPWCDIVGARLAGLKVVWINRPRGESCGRAELDPWDPLPDHEFSDLSELVKLFS